MLQAEYIFPQKSTKSKKEDIYYWFEVKLKAGLDSDLNTPYLLANQILKKISSGTFFDFAEFCKTSIKSGKIPIGPFSNKKLAKKAKIFYSVAKIHESKNAEEFIESFNPDTLTYYWFLTRLSFEDDGKFSFNRIPARVAFGNNIEFIQMIHEAHGFMNFTIGPFGNHKNAEKAKYIFRKYGELGLSSKENGKISQELKSMAKNWENVKIELKNTFNQNEKLNSQFNLEIDFPPKYFKHDVLQYIEIVLQDENHTILGTKTLQGEDFQDNNPVISFSTGKKYSIKLDNTLLNTEYLKVTLKCILFSNTELLECKPLEVELK